MSSRLNGMIDFEQDTGIIKILRKRDRPKLLFEKVRTKTVHTGVLKPGDLLIEKGTGIITIFLGSEVSNSVKKHLTVILQKEGEQPQVHHSSHIMYYSLVSEHQGDDVVK